MNVSAAEVQFHTYRLRSRAKVARLYRVDYDRLVAKFPPTDGDRVMLGKLVSIGGILAKRCCNCGVTRELEKYWASDYTASGVQAHCEVCRGRS